MDGRTYGWEVDWAENNISNFSFLKSVDVAILKWNIVF